MSNGSINTTFAGETQEGERDAPNVGLIAAIAFIVASPLTVLAAVGTYFLFSVGRVKRSVIAAALGVYMIPVLFLISPAIRWAIESWTVVFPKILEKEISIGEGIVSMLAHQFLISVPLGVLLGLAYASIRWIKRDVWNDETRKQFRITPWEYFLKKRNIADIAGDKNGPEDGTTIGINEANGKKIVQTDKEASAHTLVVGASGSGKTTLLMSKARDAIRRGQGLVFIDLKGGVDVPEILSQYAARYDRKFTHWLLQSPEEEYSGPAKNGPAYYDPLARGDATRRKDLLIASRSWSEEHYKIQASSYLQMLFGVLIGAPRKGVSTFSDIVTLLNPTALQKRAIPLGTNPKYQDIVKGIDTLNDAKISATKPSAIEGLKSQLEIILLGTAGPWLQVDTVNNHNINLFDSAHNGEIVVFSLDSSNYPELASLIANLIIQDLKTVTSELRAKPTEKPFQVFIDEFSAIEGDNIISLINKSRDANMPVTLATQALGDLEKISQTFRDQVLGIVNSFIVHRANTEDDAKIYAGLTGTVKVKKFNQQVEHDSNMFGLARGAGSGSGMVQEIEEYRVMPTEIQDLTMGNNIYISKSPFRLERAHVIPEMDKLPEAAGILPTVKIAPIGSEIVPSYGIEDYDSETFGQEDYINTPSAPEPEPSYQIGEEGFAFTSSEEVAASQARFQVKNETRKPGLENMRKLLYEGDEELAKNTEDKKYVVFPSKPAVSAKPTLSKPNLNPFQGSEPKKQAPAVVAPSIPTVKPVSPSNPNVEKKPLKPQTPKPPRKDEFDF
jgi:type IV secretory pathway TraG/TraD family ATPase VirD4